MKNIKRYLVLVIFLLSCISIYSQVSSKEKDYRITYKEKSIELLFDMPVFVKATNVKDKTEIALELETNKPNTYLLNNVEASAIIKLEYHYLYGKNYNVQTSYVAAASLSTGAITVYFNHPVDTTYSQVQNAVNLGNTLDDMLISYINACSATLDIAIYNSYSPSATTGIAGAINDAYTRGVLIRVIYDGSTSSVMIPLLNSAIPTLARPTISSGAIMHNKFVIFDANSSNPNIPLVWTGSTNWTTAQIDGPDRNSAILIQDQALAQGYKIEFEEMWGSTTMTPNTTLSKFGSNKTDNTPHTYNIGGKVVNSYFSPSDGTNAKIINTINSANTDIDIATMVETRSDLTTAITNKFNAGVTNTNIVIDSQTPVNNQINALQSALGTTRALVYSGSGIMHHKFMVVDNFNSSSDPLVLVGSHNWSVSAETKNDENTLIVHDLNIANQYYQAFAYIFQQAGGVLNTPVFNNENIGIAVYPNPSSGLFTIKANNSFVNEAEITVFDVLGNSIYNNHFTDFANQSIDITNQASGMYFITVSCSGVVSHFKVLKQ